MTSACPQCGTELRAGDPAGLCPKCLIQGAFDSAFDSSIGVDARGTQTFNPATEAAGDDDFGRYHILRTLGQGGMGTVYLAEQREPIRRSVALKVVKLGMDTDQVLARFANERQALAMMDHQNIARIFDAGATSKGRPFFVMEYIEGQPITQYCDRNRSTIGRRLELFLAVCRAVQHAHNKGVIHRDLKPSNVLVMDHEGTPLPKVIDFGIAKATDQWAIEATLLTQFGQMVGTPEYASPEQAELTTGDVDESSDVYSLGVLLYELLIGAVPFDPDRLRKAGLAEMLRMIREEEAPSLPRKLTTMGAGAVDIAARRQTDPASLRRLVDGDLNRIVLKALEKARDRRYPSAAEFAADIQRYLEHRPVLATQTRGLYRARKFLRRHRPAVLGTAGGLALVLLCGAAVWSLVRRDSPATPTPKNKGAVVLADFANTTGNPELDGMRRQLMELPLGNPPYVTLLPDARVTQTLRLMGRSPDEKLTPGIASEICERTGSAAVLEGSISQLQSKYLLVLRARNCTSGEVLDEEQAQAGKKDDVLAALGQMINRFRARAAQTLPNVEKVPSLPTEVTTPSLQAWESYSAAMKAQQSRAQVAEAIPLLKRAVEIDPQFAMAYCDLGRLYASLGESELGAQNIAKAYELRNRVSNPENYYITFNYYRQVTRNLELARQTLESWSQEIPGDFMPHGFLAAFTTQGSGHYEKAVQEGLKAIEIDPDYAIGYQNVAFAYIYLNRLADAEALLHKAAERRIEIIEFSLCRYFIAFLRNDKAAMEKERIQRQAKMDDQGMFENQEALTAAYHGRLNEAARLSDRAVLLSRQAGLRERAALFEGAHAAWNALFGSRTEAHQCAAIALALYRSRDADYGPGLALSLLHDSTQARRIDADLEKRYPEDTSVQFSYLPALKALDALNTLHGGDAAKALDFTQVAIPYDLAVPATAFYSGAFFGALYPVYVRGLAYSRMGRHREAAAEFQKVLDHPGIVLNDPIGPMARLQLARALAGSGDRAKSAAVYKDLLAIWKDADPDVPAVQEARAESARL
jgi:serine/threonine protein kinase/tetratricopeptide (TPR) repeat protein